MRSPDPAATALVAAHLAGSDPTRAGLPPSAWEAAGLAALGVELDALADALAGKPGPISTLIAFADSLLGAGSAASRWSTPFDAVRLLAPDDDRPPAPTAAGRPDPPPIRHVATLDDLSAALLRAIDQSGDATPNAADVPRVDYVRARVAVVAALLQWNAAMPRLSDETPRFLWVAGDLSGIQGYLYDIAHTGEGGVARRLRARSLFLQLLAEDLAERLRRTLTLPRANVVMRSGGKVHLLLPDTPVARAALAAEQARLDTWLLRETHGDVAFVLAWQPVTASDLMAGAFGGTLQRVDTLLAQRKATRFAAVLRPAGRWDETAFLRPAQLGSGVCPSCRKTPGSAERLCRRCAADTAVGRRLPAADAIWLVGEGAVDDDARIELPGGVALLASPPSADTTLLHIPRDDATAPGEAGGLGSYVPAGDHGAPLTFEELAQRGRGRRLLGYLKMDVDHLGEIVAFGFRRDGGPGLDTLPRLAAFSRLLDRFFSHELSGIIRREFPLCYQVYAGGDDVLVVGPWWDTVRLALRIRAAFRAWVNANPEITISAGLALVPLRAPVALAATLAGDALANAKRGYAPPDGSLVEARLGRGIAGSAVERPAPPAACVPPGGRNAASLLGEVLGWEHLAAAVAEAGRLAEMRPPRALLYRLLQFGAMWQAYRDGDAAGLRLFPYLAYVVRRTVSPREQPDLWSWANRLTDGSYRGGQEQVAVEHLALVARLTLLLSGGDGA